VGRRRSDRWTKGALADAILEQIPRDRWVSAAEIAIRLGTDPRKVGAIIHTRLLKDIERKRRSDWYSNVYVYRLKG